MPAGLVRSAWAYRGFITGSVKREFQSRYQRSALGAVWIVIYPLVMMFIYTLVFSKLMKAKLPGLDSEMAYSIYLCAGMLTWNMFSEIVSRSMTMFLENANMLKKLSFPRICLPIIVTLSACINFSIIFGMFTVFLILSGNFPGLIYFAILPVLIVHIVFSVSLGIILGVLNVFFRDVGQFFAIVLQFWFWLTPIVYPISVVPESLRFLIMFNPMTYFVGAYQSILVNTPWPYLANFLPVLLITIALVMIGRVLFRRRMGEMVDEL
jgi:lipopolysaccharide transport system permease protein